MSNDNLSKKIETVLSKELVKNKIHSYFEAKGFDKESEQTIYPPIMSNMQFDIPELFDKIEVKPYSIDIDPTTGIIRLGWNLFVLGQFRMYLGESQHTTLQDIRSAAMGGIDVQAPNGNKGVATPMAITKFVIDILSNTKGGLDINLEINNFNQPNAAISRTLASPTSSGSYSRSGIA